ncbi:MULTISPECIES: OmpA family protein [unclassified Bradyrhizobium]|uniref:OmpA/MotB family protein n=1 Tax=unclassified Bradyrhizobium TaxID=2631580 RepID=UPI001CD7AAA5|nr:MULTISPECIES: OmpA family protein [unclassified Bradyrhizobium]MCA1374335.1 OmpA family protein [Bradyrhizobium sp. IC4060]MCA1484693.1 OmpA family protein [Bradyrhizobium sp. IC4061]
MSEIELSAESSHETEDENYFISMTDMMVGMLFLFIIMLMMFALNFRKGDEDAERIRNCLQAVVKENAALSADVNTKIASVQQTIRGPIEALQIAADQRQKLLTDIKSQLEAQGIQQVEIDEQNGVVRLSERAIRFDPNKSDLDSAARENVARIARVLEPIIQRYSACQNGATDHCSGHRGAVLETVFLEGHTDSTGVADPVQRDRNNWQLSTERATNTYREILADQPELRQFRNRRGEQILSVAGYSSTRPITAVDGRDSWARNRRIDLRFVMDAETKYGIDDIRAIKTLNDEIRQQIERMARLNQEGTSRCR